jgi:hypothetical protein
MPVEFTLTHGLPKLNLLAVAVATLGVGTLQNLQYNLASVRA